MKKKTFWTFLKVVLTGYFIICIVVYFFQEKLIFQPDKLPANYQFVFNTKVEELRIKTEDGLFLDGLLFNADKSKGLIFYLHGNAGSLNSWGTIAKTYTDMNYDVFMLDYRGYGKSEGEINSQKQLYNDIQRAYDVLKTKYAENKIIILGYSIGTGPAAKLASVNKPRMLILQAPYYSLTDMMKQKFYILPTFILKYKFETWRYIQKCNMPVVIFHGNKDEVIYYTSSLKLKTLFKNTDRLITLYEQGHNGITGNLAYLVEIKKILE